LPVERIASIEDDLVAGLTMHNRWDVGVPAIVAGIRFIAQGLAPVDANLVDVHATSFTPKLIVAANHSRRQDQRHAILARWSGGRSICSDSCSEPGSPS
jgi:hypothetical protein